jgi:hypothetical protein
MHLPLFNYLFDYGKQERQSSELGPEHVLQVSEHLKHV